MAHKEHEGAAPAVNVEELQALRTYAAKWYLPLSADFEQQMKMVWEALNWPELLMNGQLRGGSREQGMAYLAELHDVGKIGPRQEAHDVILGEYKRVLAELQEKAS